MKRAFLLVAALVIPLELVAAPQKAELLWSGGAPGALGDAEEDRPSVMPYLPPADKATGTGVVVLPGGGYQMLAMDHEGRQIADWLNALGIAAFVVKYRLGPRYRHPVEMEDGQRAMRFVRFHAAEYGIAPNRIGVWGFSAGGHLASTVGTHFDAGNAQAADPVDRVSCRPDFMILAYPVITMLPPYAHMGSRRNLLGENPDPELVKNLSNELQVTAQTPPTFLFATDSDDVVPVENSVMFYQALHKNHVPAELHIFERGPHGVGLAQKDPALSIWPTLLADWFKVSGLLH